MADAKTRKRKEVTFKDYGFSVKKVSFPNMLTNIEKMVGEDYKNGTTEVLDASMSFMESYKGDIVNSVEVEDTFIPSIYESLKGNSDYYGDGLCSVRYNGNKYFYSLGSDNAYPNFLLDLKNQSSLHKSIFRACVNMAIGEGMIFLGQKGEEFKMWLNSIGVNRQFYKQALQSVALFGGFWPKFHFATDLKSLGSGQRKYKLAKLEVEKYYMMRHGKEISDVKSKFFGTARYHYFHHNYNYRSKSRYGRFSYHKLRGIPAYMGYQDTIKNMEELFIVDKGGKPYFPQKDNRSRPASNSKYKFTKLVGDISIDSTVYPEAAYESNAAISSILVDAMISAFDFASLKNGMTAGYIVTIPLRNTSRKNPAEYAKKKEIATKSFTKQFAGAENADRTIITFVDPRATDDVIKVTEIPHTNTSGMQRMMEERKTKYILTAWGVPDSRLVGVPLSGGVGFSNQEKVLRTSKDTWEELYIQPEIRTPVHEFINTDLKEIYMAEMGYMASDVQDLQAFFKPKQIFSSIPAIEIMREILPPSRIRELYGQTQLTQSEQIELEQHNLMLFEREMELRTASRYVPESGNNADESNSSNVTTRTPNAGNLLPSNTNENDDDSSEEDE